MVTSNNNVESIAYQDFKYNNKGLLSQIIGNTSTEKFNKTIYKYPFDYPAEPILNIMTRDSINMINYVVEESKFKGNTFISSKKTNYASWGSQFIQIYPKYIYVKMGTEPYLQEALFNAYDKKGNITSVLQKTQAPVCYVWSYKGQYPVAKIENIEYSTLLSLLGGITKIEEFANKSPTLAEINLFLQPVISYSQNKNILINKYSYSPFGNMLSNTSPQGNTTYYDYDNFQRIETVRDKDHRIIKNLSYRINTEGESSDSIFYNSYKSQYFIKNNCAVGLNGTSITYRVPPKKYRSNISQHSADSMAAEEIRSFGQNYANSHGACFYYNSEVSQTYTRNNCDPGVNGSSITYTVPAKKYYSFDSQHDADAKAAAELIEFGQEFANKNGTCGFRNSEIFTSLSRNNCPTNSVSVPTSVRYIIPAGRYYSPISQAEVDNMVGSVK